MVHFCWGGGKEVQLLLTEAVGLMWPWRLEVWHKQISTAPPVWWKSLWCHLSSYQGSSFQHKVSDVPSVGCFGWKWVIWQQLLSLFCWQNTQSFHIIWWRRREGNRAVRRPVRLHEDQCGERPVYRDPVQSELGCLARHSTANGRVRTDESSFFSAGGPPPHSRCDSAGESVLRGEPHHVRHAQGHGHVHTEGGRRQPRPREHLWNDRGESSRRAVKSR